MRTAVRRLPAILATTAFRLSAVYLAAFISFALLLIVFVGQRSTDILVEQARGTIAAEVASLRRVYARGGVPLLFRQVNRKARQPGANLFLIADADGRVLAGNVAEIDGGVIGQFGWTDEPFHYQRFDDDPSPNGPRKYLATAQVNRLPNDMRLLIGRDVEEARRLQQVLNQALQLALVLMVVGALLAWLLVGRHALKRIDALSESSERILSGDTSARLPVGRSGDEFDRLSARINAMLERITRMNQGLKQVSDSIAHDLKTPLTRLRNRAEEALAGRAGEDQLRSIIQEADQLIATFNALLTISRVEAGSRTDDFTAVPLHAVLTDLHELYEPVAEEEGASLTLGPIEPARVRASRELIAQAVTNLIENAIKYGIGAGGGEIALALEVVDARAVVSVTDRGPGIPKGDRERVTERFVRLDESRNLPGTGLGLSLVKAIVEMHGGTLTFGDAAPGLRATVALPLAAGSAKRGDGARIRQGERSAARNSSPARAGDAA